MGAGVGIGVNAAIDAAANEEVGINNCAGVADDVGANRAVLNPEVISPKRLPDVHAGHHGAIAIAGNLEPCRKGKGLVAR